MRLGILDYASSRNEAHRCRARLIEGLEDNVHISEHRFEHLLGCRNLPHAPAPLRNQEIDVMLRVPGWMTEIVQLSHCEGVSLVSKVILLQAVEQHQQGVPVVHLPGCAYDFLSFHGLYVQNENSLDIPECVFLVYGPFRAARRTPFFFISYRTSVHLLQ